LSNNRIQLTHSAAERIKSEYKRLLTNTPLDRLNPCVKFSVKKTGCSGFSYIIDFVDSHDDKQALSESCKVFESQDVIIYVDNNSYELVAGTTIDYVKQGIGYAMVFDNPNATALCGCGISFTVDETKKS
jgi:iron-sulfur cluster assembly protein